MTIRDTPRIAVLGAGAVGCYFGGMLGRAGFPVALIGRPEHVDAINRSGLGIETAAFDERIPVTASTDPAVTRGTDLVLLTVKTRDTEKAANLMAAHLEPGTVVMSLQNGVDNVERIRQAAGIDAVATVVYVAVAMSRPGTVRHSGRGDLIVGNLPGQDRNLDDIAAIFRSAGVPCVVSANIEGEMWKKLVMNCAYNAVSALTRSPYGPIVADPAMRWVLEDTVRETLAVAGAAGVTMPDSELLTAVIELGRTMMPEARSSTAQDIEQGRKTEIDSLNGYVARRGAALGVSTPVNQTLYALIKRLEEDRK